MNKITPQHIATLMAGVTYHVYAIEETTTTIAVAFDENGFSLATGMSACADPAIFDAEKGKQCALEDAEKKAEAKLWELEGYKLKCQLVEQKKLFDEIKDVPAGFSLFMSKPIVRKAIEIKPHGKISAMRDERNLQCNYKYTEGDDVSVYFVAHEEVNIGDFVVYLNDKDTYHCKRSVFMQRNEI
ncbi:Gp49 family protein [Catenovulum sediminis]|uniref:Gp49 family protein n=1 Tax=Catenovulum sediminis TaxID=1740262 RepID=A0ABV1RC19_9ALTE